MAVSTIPAFKGALVDRLTADANLGAASPFVEIAYGIPHPGLEREAVLVGNTLPEDPTDGSYKGGQSSAPVGQGAREERYVLETVIRVNASVREPQRTVTERAFAIAGHIENSLRTWRTASPPYAGIVRWALVSEVTHVEGISANGQERGCRVFLNIAVSARI